MFNANAKLLYRVNPRKAIPKQHFGIEITREKNVKLTANQVSACLKFGPVHRLFRDEENRRTVKVERVFPHNIKRLHDDTYTAPTNGNIIDVAEVYVAGEVETFDPETGKDDVKRVRLRGEEPDPEEDAESSSGEEDRASGRGKQGGKARGGKGGPGTEGLGGDTESEERGDS